MHPHLIMNTLDTDNIKYSFVPALYCFPSNKTKEFIRAIIKKKSKCKLFPNWP